MHVKKNIVALETHLWPAYVETQNTEQAQEILDRLELGEGANDSAVQILTMLTF